LKPGSNVVFKVLRKVDADRVLTVPPPVLSRRKREVKISLLTARNFPHNMEFLALLYFSVSFVSCFFRVLVAICGHAESAASSQLACTFGSRIDA